jgi:ParB family chromosome partitioning protein
MAKLGMLKNTQSRTGTQDSRSISLTVKDIPIGDICVKMNVRRDYTEIFELTESIRQHGLIQPITVYAAKDGYVVKTGHRRFMAYKKLYQEDPEKYHSIRSIISDAQNIALIQLVENIQRVDLSQLDLFHTLNQLREQGMTLRQIGEVIGKTEGYIKSLFVGVNEINRDNDLKDLISDAGITIRDIAETNAVTDKNQRLELLEERKSGKINRAQMREKVRELSEPTPKKAAPQTQNENGKSPKTHISIKAFPGMSKIIIYLTNGESGERLMSLENDLRSYFSANRERYRIEKAKPEKEGEK